MSSSFLFQVPHSTPEEESDKVEEFRRAVEDWFGSSFFDGFDQIDLDNYDDAFGKQCRKLLKDYGEWSWLLKEYDSVVEVFGPRVVCALKGPIGPIGLPDDDAFRKTFLQKGLLGGGIKPYPGVRFPSTDYVDDANAFPNMAAAKDKRCREEEKAIYGDVHYDFFRHKLLPVFHVKIAMDEMFESPCFTKHYGYWQRYREYFKSALGSVDSLLFSQYSVLLVHLGEGEPPFSTVSFEKSAYGKLEIFKEISRQRPMDQEDTGPRSRSPRRTVGRD